MNNKFAPTNMPDCSSQQTDRQQTNRQQTNRPAGLVLLCTGLLAVLVTVAGCRPTEGHRVGAVAPGAAPRNANGSVAPPGDDRPPATEARTHGDQRPAAPSGQGSSAPPPVFSPDEILPTIPWQDAAKFVGREVFLVGPVTRTGHSKTGHVFLNFGDEKSGPKLTGFIHSKVAEQFDEPPEKQFAGQLVRIRGDLYRYKDDPNIRIAAPARIRILPPGTPLPSSVDPAPSVRKVAGDTVTIACYNVMNLFDSYDDDYRSDEGTRPKPRDQLEILADSIRKLDADVLALSEVENRGILEQFNAVLLRDMGYAHVVLFEGNDLRGIDVALLSRLPVGPVTSYRHLQVPDANGFSRSFRRDLLRVRIEPEGGEAFDVFLVHFKSKGGDPGGEEIRLAEAQMTRRALDRVLEQDPEAAFVVCGDFNDLIDSPALREVIGSGPGALKTFVDQLPEDNRVTYNQKPYLSMIDFIFASPAMARQYVDRSYRIIPGSPQRTGSDHNPVVARFRIR